MQTADPHSRNLRKGRCSSPGQYYFLTTATAGRRKLFAEASNAEFVVNAIRWLHAIDRFEVDAAVAMPDHLHIAGQLRGGTLAGFMHSMKSYTAKRLSSAGISPPIWQSGYHDHGLRHDEDYRAKVRYLLENPKRAGLAKGIDDYPYVVLPEWWIPEAGS